MHRRTVIWKAQSREPTHMLPIFWSWEISAQPYIVQCSRILINWTTLYRLPFNIRLHPVLSKIDKYGSPKTTELLSQYDRVWAEKLDVYLQSGGPGWHHWRGAHSDIPMSNHSLNSLCQCYITVREFWSCTLTQKFSLQVLCKKKLINSVGEMAEFVRAYCSIADAIGVE